MSVKSFDGFYEATQYQFEEESARRQKLEEEHYQRVDNIRKDVATIEELAGKNKDMGAHVEEDILFRKVLRAIADGAPMPQELAREALKSRDVIFDRAYAH